MAKTPRAFVSDNSAALRASPMSTVSHRRPLDIALVGMDGIGKGTIASALKGALVDAGLTVQLIDLPHYSDLQGVSLFKKVSRGSKALIEKGVRTGDSRKISAGSLLAALTVRTARAMTKRADVRLIVRHPGIEVD